MTQCPHSGNVRRRRAAEEHKGVRGQLTLLLPVQRALVFDGIVGVWSLQATARMTQTNILRNAANAVFDELQSECCVLWYVQMWTSAVTSRATPRPCAQTVRDLSSASANRDTMEMVSSATLKMVVVRSYLDCFIQVKSQILKHLVYLH